MPRYENKSIRMKSDLKRKPEWIRTKLPQGDNYYDIKQKLSALDLNTVCEEANCPNIAECWGGGTATFMLLGDTCTRGCRFCNVKAGKPQGIIDELEPERVAKAVKEMQLRYVVLTSVARDDLEDGGADHFAKTISMIKKYNPEILIECLIPDFANNTKSLKVVINAGLNVLAHNIETVERLTWKVRDPRSSYKQSLQVLKNMKNIDNTLLTKSSIMLGLGEEDSEIIDTMNDLREEKVDMLTIGQYLQPSSLHLDLIEYIKPEKFAKFKKIGEEIGFAYVASGPLVRSSYKAGELFVQKIMKTNYTGVK